MLNWVVLLSLHLITVGVWSDVDVCERRPDCRFREIDAAVDSTIHEGFPGAGFLDEHCGLVLEVLTCAIDFAKACPTEMDAEEMSVFEAGKEYISDICTEGSSTRTEYLKSRECFNENLSIFPNCSARADDVVEHVIEFKSDQMDEEEMGYGDGAFRQEMHCLKMSVNVECILGRINHICGQEHTRPVEEVYRRFVYPALGIHCPEELMRENHEKFQKFVKSEYNYKK